MLQTDYLIIGSGIAGLSTALNLSQSSPECSITIVTKSKLSDSATSLAQGGLAGVMHPRDSFEKHISDTLKAGDGLCNTTVVDSIIRNAPEGIYKLAKMGATFDREPAGNFDLALEGGHSYSRIVHTGDHTGLEISAVLIRNVRAKKNIRILEVHFTIDLITNEESDGKRFCSGAKVVDQKKNVAYSIFAKAVVLATGGAGQIFKVTTNPAISTGDGIAMAGRAGAELENMEFFQFHPTALFVKNVDNAFLISEAVRGAGAILRNILGKRFMFDYDARGELASRDIVSRAIRTEMINTRSECVWLDCRLIPEEEFKNHFPTIYNQCFGSGIDPTAGMIPVRPAAHYCCGGIKTDLNGATTITNLFALGECASTGLHGANRLASNSLTEALVLANKCATFLTYKFVSAIPVAQNLKVDVFLDPHNYSGDRVKELKTLLKAAMWTNAIVCDNVQLKKTSLTIDQIENELQVLKIAGNSVEILEFENMVDVSKLVLQASLSRKKNCGTFYKIDKNVNHAINHNNDFNLTKV